MNRSLIHKIEAVKHNSRHNSKRCSKYWVIETFDEGEFKPEIKPNFICDTWFCNKIPKKLKDILEQSPIDPTGYGEKRGNFVLTLNTYLKNGHVDFENVFSLEGNMTCLNSAEELKAIAENVMKVETLQQVRQEQEITSCRICGKPTLMPCTKLCDRCWELETRIRDDLELAKKIIARLESAKKKQISEQKTCAIHTFLELNADGTCTSCGR